MRGTEFQIAATLVTETCCNCGMLFAMTGEYRRQRMEDHGSFYCPAGHSQRYVGKTEAEKLKEELKRVERRLENVKAEYESEHSARRATERSLSATKGVLTRTKNRIKNGVCPCCNRHFENLERHMSGKHPDYEKEST